MVDALNNFFAQTHELDTNHQDQVVNVRDTIMQLYNNDPPFQGKAADNLFNVLLDYLQAEHAFSGDMQGDTSPQLAQAVQYCQTTASTINQQLQTLYNESDQYAYQLDQDRAVPEWDRLFRNFPPDDILNADCVLPPTTITRVQTMEDDEIPGEIR